ncbi:MAG: hypothetical protein HIU82_02160 [Proteobacteria bacterium]|nr:hypothetical protein [Pseudomonadota bacterium]
MHTIIKPVISRAFVFAEGTAWRDPWIASVLIAAHGLDHDVAHLQGLHMDGYTREHRASVRQALAGAGYRFASWYRGDGRLIVRPVAAPGDPA